MKKLPEKMIIAVIILSCGFVMQTDPPEQSRQTKEADKVEVKGTIDATDASRHDGKGASASPRGDDRAPR